jgi:hypothetical protein
MAMVLFRPEGIAGIAHGVSARLRAQRPATGGVTP